MDSPTFGQPEGSAEVIRLYDLLEDGQTMQIELRGRRRPSDKVTWEIWKEAGEGRIRGWPLSDSDLVTRCPPAGHKTFREFWTHQTSFWGSSTSLHGEFTQVYSVRVDGWVEWHRGLMVS